MVLTYVYDCKISDLTHMQAEFLKFLICDLCVTPMSKIPELVVNLKLKASVSQIVSALVDGVCVGGAPELQVRQIAQSQAFEINEAKGQRVIKSNVVNVVISTFQRAIGQNIKRGWGILLRVFIQGLLYCIECFISMCLNIGILMMMRMTLTQSLLFYLSYIMQKIA
jgi:hypothetical protein